MSGFFKKVKIVVAMIILVIGGLIVLSIAYGASIGWMSLLAWKATDTIGNRFSSEKPKLAKTVGGITVAANYSGQTLSNDKVRLDIRRSPSGRIEISEKSGAWPIGAITIETKGDADFDTLIKKSSAPLPEAYQSLVREGRLLAKKVLQEGKPELANGQDKSVLKNFAEGHFNLEAKSVEGLKYSMDIKFKEGGLERTVHVGRGTGDLLARHQDGTDKYVIQYDPPLGCHHSTLTYENGKLTKKHLSDNMQGKGEAWMFNGIRAELQNGLKYVGQFKTGTEAEKILKVALALVGGRSVQKKAPVPVKAPAPQPSAPAGPGASDISPGLKGSNGHSNGNGSK